MTLQFDTFFIVNFVPWFARYRTLWPILFLFVYLHDSIFPTVPIQMFRSVYCDKIGKVLLCSIHIW